MATHKKTAQGIDANVTVESRRDAKRVVLGFNVPTWTVDTAVEIARGGLRLGLGLTALAIEGAAKATEKATEQAQEIGKEAIKRGTHMEKKGRESFVAFEREQVASMKDYLRRARESAQSRRAIAPKASIEAQVEDVLATLDVPTREDVRELNRNLAHLSDQVAKLQRA